MTDARMPYDQRLARSLVRPLAGTALRPNHVTVLSALVALTGAGLLATGDTVLMNWGAGLFAVGRFLDHLEYLGSAKLGDQHALVTHFFLLEI